MTTLVGAERHRLIADSLFRMVQGCLVQLGWMTKTDWHQAVTMLSDAVDEEDKVVFNTVAMADDDVTPLEFEIGSSMTEDTWNVWFDVYAENATIGKSIGMDIRDILAGRHPDVGRTQGGLLVLDYTQATPVPIISCAIEKVDLLRVRNTSKPWMRYWWTVRCDVVDEYGAS